MTITIEKHPESDSWVRNGVGRVSEVDVIAPEARMMRKPEIQIGNSNSKWSNKFKLRRRL
jgi:hypothetical protein